MAMKMLTGFILLGFIFMALGAIDQTAKPAFRNLKVLPRDISDSLLQKIMEEDCSKALGVGCDYCHVKKAGSNELDYASDGKPEKEIARNMMRMTLDINKNYFNITHPLLGDSLLSITCISCHHGEPYPGKK